MGRDANILYENYFFVLDPLLHTVLRFSQLHSYLNILKDPKFPFFSFVIDKNVLKTCKILLNSPIDIPLNSGTLNRSPSILPGNIRKPLVV